MDVPEFKPPKSLWTHHDFEQMSWHDNLLHGIGIVNDFDPHQHEVRFDIDYIFEWSGHCKPGPEGFWISPSTLVFPASDLNIEMGKSAAGYWIMGIERSNASPRYEGGPIEWTWEISFNGGGFISLQSGEYAQYTRSAPVFVACPDQCLETRQRGSISFEKTLYDAPDPEAQ